MFRDGCLSSLPLEHLPCQQSSDAIGTKLIILEY